jgi:hypothetical protein
MNAKKINLPNASQSFLSGNEMRKLTTCVEGKRGGDEMPDISQAEVGRRLYHVHREKRIERAIKKIKQNIGPDWQSFTEEDIRILGHLLQCTWNIIDQKVWDDIPFAKMTKNDVQKILSYGIDVGPRKNPDQGVVEEIKKILLAKS